MNVILVLVLGLLGLVTPAWAADLCLIATYPGDLGGVPVGSWRLTVTSRVTADDGVQLFGFIGTHLDRSWNVVGSGAILLDGSVELGFHEGVKEADELCVVDVGGRFAPGDPVGTGAFSRVDYGPEGAKNLWTPIELVTAPCQ